MSILTLLMDRLRDEEGRVLNPNGRHVVYNDPKGIPTIGYGRNVRDRGLSEDEARYLLENDVSQAIVELAALWPPFVLLTEARKLVIADLYFNMALGNLPSFLSEFAPTLSLVAAGKYADAAAHMRGWKWYTDVGPRRADPLIAMMRSGIVPAAKTAKKGRGHERKR